MAADPQKPGIASVLLRDAGLSVAGAALFAVLFVAGARWTHETGAVAKGPALSAAQGQLAILLLTFYGSLVLTGPQSLIGRMGAFAVLVGSVFAGFVAEAAIVGGHAMGTEAKFDEAVGAVRGAALAAGAVAATYALVLFAAGWLLRCLGAGRAFQYGAAVLMGMLLNLGTLLAVEPALRQIKERPQQQLAIEWFFRLNPTAALNETAQYTAWLTDGTFYRSGGETIINIRGTGSAPTTGKPGNYPAWQGAAMAMVMVGSALWTVAAFFGFIRNRMAKARAARGE